MSTEENTLGVENRNLIHSQCMVEALKRVGIKESGSIAKIREKVGFSDGMIDYVRWSFSALDQITPSVQRIRVVSTCSS